LSYNLLKIRNCLKGKKGGRKMKVIVGVPKSEDTRKKSWRKELVNVDKSQSNGYAFIGNWLKGGERAELEVGSYILAYDEPGSMKHWSPHVRLFRVQANGELEKIYDWEGGSQEKSWALAVRDEIADIVYKKEDANLTEEEKEIVEKLRLLSSERIELILKALKEEK